MSAPVSRRSFIAGVMAIVAGTVAAVKLARQPRELTAEDYIPVDVGPLDGLEVTERFYRVENVMSPRRRHPPGMYYYLDPKAVEKFYLVAPDRETLAREFERNVRFLQGRRWITERELSESESAARSLDKRFSRAIARIRRALA